MTTRQQESDIRAVEYVRMSTEQQHFSIDAQRRLIGEFAHEHGYNIVRSYSDPGQSGLSLRGRKALQALLSDALNPERDFSTILIRDISRWGRFQDPDQAAHYEFICRQAGVQIVYCAEPFISGTTPVSTIVKHLKRVMASEYSRDLSDKMSRAHLYHASLGYKQGGVPVYGFRRLVVDECNTPKYILQPGETKTLIGERVRIVLGTFEEQEVVRSIFELYVEREWSLIEIALFLQNQGITGNLGKPWTFRMVRNVLTCELCIGCYTYNKTTQKLQTPPRKNPEALWVRAPDICTPLVSQHLFSQAQQRLLKRRPSKLSHAKMLEHLRDLVDKKGRISLTIVNRAPFIPHASTYARYFGNIERALKQIEYHPPLCIGRGERAWSADVLRIELRRLYREYGFLSKSIMSAAPGLPSYASIRRKIGTLDKVYDFIGVPHGGPDDIRCQATARRSERMRGRPGCKGARYCWDEQTLVKRMKRLLIRHGYLSETLINASSDLPSVTTLRNRFGSMLDAYRATGWNVDRSALATARRARSTAGSRTH